MALAEYTPQPHKFNRFNKNGLFGRDSVGSLFIWVYGWGSVVFIRRPLEKVVKIDAGRWRRQHSGPGGCEAD
jgi:hypothetical protein